MFVFVVAALLAAACSSDAPPAAPDLPVDSLPFADTTLEPANRFGGVAQIGMARVGELDPVSADFASTEVRILVDLLYDGLTSVDSQSLEPVPALASAWTVDEEQQAWRFELANTRFANGRTIEPADVKWSLERVVQENPTSRAAQDLSVIVGFDEFVAGQADEISGLVAEGATELAINLSEPFSPLAHLLAAPVYGVVPAEIVTAGSSAFADQPSASGPFAVSSRDETSLQLERTDRYTGSLHGIEVILYDDADAAFAAFSGGAIDWVVVPPASSGAVDRAIGREVVSPADATVYFGMNSAHANLADVNLRRAILRAVDVDSIVAELLPAVGVSATGVLPSGTLGAREDACGEACEYDAARAAATVSFLGDGTGPSVAIDYLVNDPTETALANALADDLAAAGIDASLRPGTLEELSERIVNGEHQLFRYGWSGAYGSPDAWLAASYRASSTENVTALADPAIDASIVRAREATSSNGALVAYQSAEDAVLEQALVLPLVSLQNRSAVSDRLQGVTQRPDGTLDLSDAWLE